MNRRILLFVLLGIGIVAVVLAITLYLTRGSHIELKGTVQTFRTLAVEESAAIAVVDFRFVNPSNYPFVVRKLVFTITMADGQRLEGTNIPEIDARRVFEYYPVLGQKYNETLFIKEKIAPRQSLDRMLGARFEVPAVRIERPQEIRLRIEDVDGAFSEIVR